LYYIIEIRKLAYPQFSYFFSVSQDKGTFLEALKESPPSMLTGDTFIFIIPVCFIHNSTVCLLGLINVVSIWSVLGLSGFHTYLLALGQTTNEDIKGTFNRKLHPQVKNPYSSGNCITNILSTICSPEKPRFWRYFYHFHLKSFTDNTVAPWTEEVG